MAYDVFISYRRDRGADAAGRLNEHLVKDGYTVSFDVDSLGNGNFNEELLRRAAECRHFVVLLSEGCFDRTLNGCPMEEDWLRRELATALYNRRNVIPIMLPGFTEFPKGLPADIAEVAKYNGPEYARSYWDAFYMKLKHDFLRKETIPQRPVSIESVLARQVHAHLECRADAESLFGDDARSLRDEVRHTYERMSRVLPYVEIQRIDRVWKSGEDHLAKGDSSKASRRFLEVMDLILHATPCSSPFVMRMVGDGINTHGPDWYASAMSRALGGDPDYQYGLGTLYAAGLGVPKDPSSAFNWYEKAREGGNVLAEVALGVAYLSGAGVAVDGTKAFDILRPAAEKGQPQACAGMGMIFRDGIGRPVDLAEAKRWFLRAVDAGNSSAMVALAQLLEKDESIEDARGRALTYYRRAAQDENPVAERILGERLYYGDGCDRNPADAYRYCCAAAEKGDAEAFVLLGRAVEEGWGCEIDLDKARKLYSRAVELGSSSGREALRQLDALVLYGMAQECLRGAETEDDFRRARVWLEKAVRQGHVSSMERLGFMLERGLGGDIDVCRAVELYEQAEKSGCLSAVVALGKLSYWGSVAAVHDFKKAHDLFWRAAGQWSQCKPEERWSVSYAFYYLARIYYEGVAVERDQLLSIRCLLRAALAGNTAACRLMGWSYAEGKSVPQSTDEAERWYRAALASAEDGRIDWADDDGMNAIGYLYTFGQGVDKDPAMGAVWMQKSMKLGNTQALRHMGFAFRNGMGVMADSRKSFECFLSAANRGNVEAMSSVGWYYYKGIVERDVAKAKEWAERAAKDGSTRAMELLHRLYRDGDGVDRDVETARKWLLAAVRGRRAYKGALSSLGYYYEHGLLQFPTDCVLAFDYYKRAAETDARGKYHFGLCYLEGVGTPVDVKAGLGWLCQAADQTDEDLYFDVRAADELARRYRFGLSVGIDLEQAEKWSKRADALRSKYGLSREEPPPEL